MATPSEKLAESLELLRKLQNANGAAIRAENMPRTHGSASRPMGSRSNSKTASLHPECKHTFAVHAPSAYMHNSTPLSCR